MKNTVICPVCGREYLPEEIYTKKSLYGSPKSVARNEYGKIIGFDGNTVNLDESYTCDSCNTFFRVSGKMVFNTSIAVNKQFEEEYTSKLTKASL